MEKKDKIDLDLDFLGENTPKKTESEKPEKATTSEHKKHVADYTAPLHSAEPKKPVENLEATPREQRNQVWAAIGIVALIIGLIVVAVVSDSKKIEYVTSGPGVYLLPQGEFALYFPEKPAFETSSQTLLSAKETPYRTENYDYRSPDGNYFISATHIPNAFLTSSDTPEENISKQLAYTGNTWGNKIISSTPTTYKGYPAIDFVATTGGNNYIGKDVLVGDHLYMIGYSYDPSKTTEDKDLEKKIFESIDFYDPEDYPEAASITYAPASLPADHCEKGFTFDKNANKCVTLLQYCKNLSGSGATYNASDNTCGCAVGYLVDANNKCVYVPPAKTGYQVCADMNGTWDGYSKTSNGGYDCTCRSGYEPSANNATCVLSPVKSGYQVCREEYGSYATWDGYSKTPSGGYSCSCLSGYYFDESTNRCY